MRKTLRAVAKAPRKGRTPARRVAVKLKPSPEISAEEATHLELISRRYEEAEKAWLRMTAPLDGDEPWGQVEEHLLARAPHDQDRRWKYFSK